jgi:hypothetical protein
MEPSLNVCLLFSTKNSNDYTLSDKEINRSKPVFSNNKSDSEPEAGQSAVAPGTEKIVVSTV